MWFNNQEIFNFEIVLLLYTVFFGNFGQRAHALTYWREREMESAKGPTQPPGEIVTSQSPLYFLLFLGF